MPEQPNNSQQSSQRSRSKTQQSGKASRQNRQKPPDLKPHVRTEMDTSKFNRKSSQQDNGN